MPALRTIFPPAVYTLYLPPFFFGRFAPDFSLVFPLSICHMFGLPVVLTLTAYLWCSLRRPLLHANFILVCECPKQFLMPKKHGEGANLHSCRPSHSVFTLVVSSDFTPALVCTTYNNLSQWNIIYEHY